MRFCARRLLHRPVRRRGRTERRRRLPQAAGLAGESAGQTLSRSAQGFRRDALRGRRPRSGSQHDGAGRDPWRRSRIRGGKARLAIRGALGPYRRAYRTVNGKRYFTGALLLFPHHVADDVLSAVDRMAKRLKGELRRNAKKQGEPAEINDHGVRQLLLSGSVACRLLTQTWLVGVLAKAQAPLPEIRNTDGEEIVFSQVRFPIVGDVAKIAATLDGIDRFERDDAGELRWSWHGPGSPSQDVTKPARGPD